MIFAEEKKESSFTISLNVSFADPSPKTYGLFVESLSEKQAQGIIPKGVAVQDPVWRNQK